MRRKYFFFDIDGTLSTGLTTTMPESAVKCLDLLRQAGHFTAIATGRLQPPRKRSRIATALPISSPTAAGA
ncbi:hypothetical protein DW766_00255 [Butyricicoccus sp. AM29-23AC]|nr:hypothetical protein DW766_00255 [Butyricicoccus sp. AM29-23AC]